MWKPHIALHERNVPFTFRMVDPDHPENQARIAARSPTGQFPDWVHPFDERHTALAAYRARRLSRPSVARVVDEARPYRRIFPLGAPDRD